MTEIETKLESVQSTFRTMEAYLDKDYTSEDLIYYINLYPKHYFPVALEALSMHLAINDFKEKKDLQNWKKWVDYFGSDFYMFFYLGLGMAISKTNAPKPVFPEFTDTSLEEMVDDGIGYYSALFNARKTFGGQQLPPIANGIEATFFDQGVGRRMLYYYKGDLKAAIHHIMSFEPKRQPALFRGLGIAYGFVDLSSEDNKIEIENLSSENRMMFIIGMILIVNIKLKTHVINNKLLQLCTQLSGISLLSLQEQIDAGIINKPVTVQINIIESLLIPRKIINLH